MVGKILIVDDVATNRIVFKVKLGAACYQPLLAASGESCLDIARAAQPDLILLDMMLPDMSGIDVIHHLRTDPRTCDIPVVVFSAAPDAETRLAALRAGADDFLGKPIDDAALLARLRSLLRGREPQNDLGPRGATLQALGLAEEGSRFLGPGTLALVAERRETAMRWRKELSALLSDRLVVLSREEALVHDDLRAPPDVFVIEADLGTPGGGLRLMSDLRSRASSRHAAVCILQPDTGGDRVAMAFDLGANDVVSPRACLQELALRLRTLLARKRRADRMRASVQDGLRLAVIDPLTGLYNRRYALPQLSAIAAAAQTENASFAVMIVDLDRFKSVNDHWGHGAGDAVLVEVARRLASHMRPGDLLARIGGEEFLIATVGTGLTEARATAERLCRAVQETPVQMSGGGSLAITISIGLAIGGADPSRLQEPVSDVVDRADRALLTAKAEGRNQVTIGRTAA